MVLIDIFGINKMETEYTTSTGKKILYRTSAVLFSCSALLFFIMNFIRPDVKILLAAIMFLFAAAAMASQIKRKIIISAEHIIKIDVFGKKELTVSNIKGFRIKLKAIYIEAISTSHPKITINNYLDFANYEDLIRSLKENFSDLGAQA